MTLDAFSDEDLTAWLDGEASGDLSQRIKAADGPALQVRLAELRSGRALAETMFAEALQLAPPMPSLPAQTQSTSSGWIAGGLIGLAAGLLLAVAPMLWRSHAIEPWHQDVAAYQALYIPQTLASVPADGAADLARLSDALGRDLTGLPEVSQLEFRRAQALGFEGRVLIQIAYRGPDGVPYALCILNKSGDATDLEAQQLAGMQAASWADQNHRFLLIGGTDAQFVQNAAQQFAAAL